MTEERWRTGRGFPRDYFSETIIDEETGKKYYGGIKAGYVSSKEIVEILNNYERQIKELEQLCDILKEKIQFYEDNVVNPECPICRTILRKISIDYEKDRYYRKCPKCGYEKEESLI